jgi:ABC-type phosphate/phosphonate transport system ATPase subunit
MLKLDKLTRRFGDNLAVNNANLTIPDGQMVGIIGRSGAGKSTLLRSAEPPDRSLRGPDPVRRQRHRAAQGQGAARLAVRLRDDLPAVQPCRAA